MRANECGLKHTHTHTNHKFTENITTFSSNKTAQFLITELVNDIIENVNIGHAQ